MGDYGKRCLQCGKPTVRGRAWCQRCLRRVSLGLPTDLDHVPKANECASLTAGSSDRPFPFWPVLTNRKP